MKRLAIVTSHPIQYNAPLFELLAKRKRIEIKVFYSWGESVLEQKYDPGFGKVIKWDIPLLEGYEYEFLENISKDKGSHNFKGIDNPDIIEKIKKFHPDAVLVYGWAYKSHLKVLRYFKNKIPVLFRGDSTLLDERSWVASLKRNLFLRWVYRHIDFALYVGKNNYKYFRNAGLNKDQLIFAPHAVDNQRFECSSATCKKNAVQLRDDLNIPEGDLVFMYAGKLENVKDPGIILQAFSNLSFPPRVHLVIVGNGNLESDLKTKSKSVANIHFIDFQNQMQMPAVYEIADIFILSSKSETWGLSVNEAMANGKAIIVSDQCGCFSDLVAEGINGYIFKAGNAIDLQMKMELILQNISNLAEMKRKSSEKIKMFSLPIVAAAIEKILT
ncbi:MAG TPA: glycosyltransferase family 4 protein [Hanamia sp.]